LGAADEHTVRERLLLDLPLPAIEHVVVAVSDWIAEPGGLFAADFDLLARMPGVKAIDVVSTDAVLGSGFHERIHSWLPGIEEVRVDGGGQRPVLLVPDSRAAQPWFTSRDREEELVMVAERVKAKRRREPFRSPRLDRTAVVYKGPLPYLYLAPGTLSAAGIPWQTRDGLPLAAEPLAAAVDLVLDCVESGFTRRSLVAILTSPHLSFGKGPDLDRHSTSALNRALSEQQFLGGVDGLERAADAIRRNSVHTGGEVEPALEAALAAAHELASLGESAPASAQIRRLTAFLDAHLLQPRPPLSGGSGTSSESREHRARRAIDDLLVHLADAHEGHHDPAWTVADLAASVRRWIGESTFAAHSTSGGVQLVDDQAARFGDYDDLFIVGLVEHEWPERNRRNIFYSPRLLKLLGWPSERERRAGDDARFLDLIASASGEVVLSTFLLDEQSVVTRSAQLDEIARARLETVPMPQGPGTRMTWEDALAIEPPVVDALDGLAREWAEMRMSRPPGDSPSFHGTVGSYPARRWSISALETYLACPFKFFAQHVLRLEEPPDDEEVMDPRKQGLFVHTVFQRFFAEWQARGLGRVTADNLEQARALFADVADQELTTLPGAEAALERTKLLGSAAAAGLGEAVLRMEAERPLAVVERLLEWPLERGRLFTVASASGERRLQLGGQIDRIDLLEDGTFRLIDYKLGWPPDRSRALQLPVYSVCAEQQLDGHRGRRWTLGEAVYLAFKGPRRVVPLFANPSARADVLLKAQHRLTEAVDRIDRGEFPPAPDDLYRCETCSFSQVCRKDYVGEL
jgi:RecB family exonuclease